MASSLAPYVLAGDFVEGDETLDQAKDGFAIRSLDGVAGSASGHAPSEVAGSVVLCGRARNSKKTRLCKKNGCEGKSAGDKGT